MQFKTKIVILAVLPLLAAVTAIGAIMIVQAQRLAELQAAAMEESFLALRRTELTHYVGLALTSIDHLYKSGRDDEQAKNEAKRILRSMSYGEDGYFFVYDLEGRNLVLPRKPELEGKLLLDMRDAGGLPVIQILLALGRDGGGFQQYHWEKPSTGKITRKLGYALKLERWGWMVGTGLYLDGIEQATSKLRNDISANIAATMWWLAIVAVISAVFVFASGMMFNVSERRLADGKLKDLAQRIVNSPEAERTRVSRELHDGISQLLVAIKYQFELVQHRLMADGNKPVNDLSKELVSLQGVITEVRRISHALRPSLLDNLGLASALEQLGAEFSQRTGVLVSVRTDTPGDPLPEAETVTLFRIAQEAFTNIERHAQARAVQVELASDKASMRLRIVDDGRGFDVTGIDRSASNGIGLRNIRERIEHHGGSLGLASSPGCTELVVTLPLKADV